MFRNSESGVVEVESDVEGHQRDLVVASADDIDASVVLADLAGP